MDRHSLGRPPVAALIASALLAVGALAMPAASSDAAGSAAASCPTVYFVGARGSGEGGAGLGTRVGALYDDFVKDLPSGATHSAQPVPYSADKINDLIPSLKEVTGYFNRPTSAFAKYEKNHVDKYLASVGRGTIQTVKLLAQLHQKCPASQFVVAGYSQGAMALHEALESMTTGTPPSFVSKIVAVALIADPDEVKNGTGHRLGTAASTHLGLAKNNKNIPSTFKSKTWSICDEHDIVCDFSFKRLLAPTTPKKAWNRFEDYKAGHLDHYTASNSAIKKTAEAVAALVKPPKPSTWTPGDLSISAGSRAQVGSVIYVVPSKPCPSGSVGLNDTQSVDNNPQTMQSASGINADGSWGFDSVPMWLLETASDATTLHVNVDCIGANQNILGSYEQLDVPLSAGIPAVVSYLSAGATSGDVTVTPDGPCPVGTSYARITIDMNGSPTTTPEFSKIITLGSSQTWPRTVVSTNEAFTPTGMFVEVSCADDPNNDDPNSLYYSTQHNFTF